MNVIPILRLLVQLVHINLEVMQLALLVLKVTSAITKKPLLLALHSSFHLQV